MYRGLVHRAGYCGCTLDQHIALDYCECVSDEYVALATANVFGIISLRWITANDM